MKAYKYGIELELCVPRSNYGQFTAEVEALGLLTSSDCSIQSGDGRMGIEVKTEPIGYNAGIRLMSKFCKVAERYNCEVNQSCGYHLHTSNKRFFTLKNLKRIMTVWIAIEDCLYATQPASRLSNRYCKRLLADYAMNGGLPKLSVKKEDLIADAECHDRYYALNINALYKHGTLEVRMHSGTLNKTKIQNWMDLVTAVYDYALTRYDDKAIAELMKETISDDKIQKALKLLGLSDTIVDFYVRRAEQMLYRQLERQQISANKLMETSKTWKATEKKWRMATREYDEARNERASLTACFS